MNRQTITLPFDVPLLPARTLASNGLSCLYEHGRLRYIKYGEVEVVRMIYFAVRDENWHTAPYTIHHEVVEEKENGFTISYTSIHRLPGIEYKTLVSIIAEGNVIYLKVNGEALSSFKRNRIGICVHHPIKEYSGKELTIKRKDGTTYIERFPELISPHQPFKDIQEMECLVNDALLTRLIFEGDVFETEDQRNWADSSYKTYSTPLSIPFPVQVNEGNKMEQKVRLSIAGKELLKGEKDTIKEEDKIAFPQIGYSRKNGERLGKEEIYLLKQLPFDKYRTELFLINDNWQQEFEAADWEATELQVKLELILFFTDDFKNQVPLFLEFLKKTSSIIDSILVLQTGEPTTPNNLLELAYTQTKKQNASIKVGYGTDGFFADLNRNRPRDVPFDFISFSLNPQVHSFDTRSLIENLECLSDLVQTAHLFAAKKEVHISPITLKIRTAQIATANEYPADYDARQHTSFAAIWTLSALNNLSHADSLGFFQTTGYRGIVDGTKSIGSQSPLFHILKRIKDFQPVFIIHTDSFSSLPDSITIENAEGDRIVFEVFGS